MSEKLTSIYSLRISDHLKEMADKLTIDSPHPLNHQIRIDIAKAIHNEHFDEKVYLDEHE